MIDSTVSHRHSTTPALFIMFVSIPGIRYRLHLGKLINSRVKKAHAASRTRKSPTQLWKAVMWIQIEIHLRLSSRVIIFFSVTGMSPFLVWIFIIFIRLFPQSWNRNFVCALALRVKLSLLLNFYWTCSIFPKFHNFTVTTEERLWAYCYRQMLQLNLSNPVMFFIPDTEPCCI